MIKFRKVREKLDLEMILKWRTSRQVTRYMINDLVFDLEKQKEWYKKVIEIHDPAQHWIITYNDMSIGFLSLENLKVNQETSWGFYIAEQKFWIHGGLIPAYFYNYMFFKRDRLINKITGYAFEDNLNVMKLHRFYGCSEIRNLEKVIKKNGVPHKLIFIEMTRKKWNSQQKKFGNYYSSFEA
ncbi:GNAT family N-acetyltransferase [Paracoccaceae bacterium]|nr:GNAT family N-acetyltransferase [Paracoccaceae bacterium]